MKQQALRDQAKAPRVREAVQFDAYWNNKAGKFDNATDYVFSFRERRGWFRGAIVRN